MRMEIHFLTVFYDCSSGGLCRRQIHLFLLWIHHLFFRDVIKHLIQVAVGPPLAHGQAGIQIVAAVLGLCAGDLSLKITHEFKDLISEFN